MRRYYLGLNAGGPGVFSTLFSRGTRRDLRDLSEFLAGKYLGAPMLTKNGRSALALALKAYFEPGDKIIVNGFTCYAVIEAVRKAGMTPIFADIEPATLNFDQVTLEKLLTDPVSHGVRGIIVQNTLGNPVDMKMVEKIARKYKLVIIEDLAHSAGVKYPDGREAGTVGAATVLSFGKDKSVNAISGGAVVLRETKYQEIEAPSLRPRMSDHLRARFYPLLTAISRGLNHVHLGGGLMRIFLALHFVERTADSRLDFRRRLSKFEAKMALRELRELPTEGRESLREFLFVSKRKEVLERLRAAGYFFDGLWYEKPVAPERYYKNVQFPEKNCPVAVKVAKKIINLPKYYSEEDLLRAREIIEPYRDEIRAPEIPAENKTVLKTIPREQRTGKASPNSAAFKEEK